MKKKEETTLMCPGCGEWIPLINGGIPKHCPECGKSMLKDNVYETSKKSDGPKIISLNCPKCGAALSGDKNKIKFCEFCGEKLMIYEEESDTVKRERIRAETEKMKNEKEAELKMFTEKEKAKRREDRQGLIVLLVMAILLILIFLMDSILVQNIG